MPRVCSSGRALTPQACAIGAQEAFAFLLKHGADVNATCKSQATPLLCAARGGHSAMVAKLIAGGADLFAVDKSTMSGLHHAASQGHAPVMRELIKACRAFDRTPQGGEALRDLLALPNIEGQSALHLAAQAGHGACVRALLDAARSLDSVALSDLVNAREAQGQTPLFYAAAAGQADIVRALIAAGADSQADCAGVTAADVAASASIARMLQQSKGVRAVEVASVHAAALPTSSRVLGVGQLVGAAPIAWSHVDNTRLMRTSALYREPPAALTPLERDGDQLFRTGSREAWAGGGTMYATSFSSRRTRK